MAEKNCHYVSEVRLNVGQFSGVEPELLRSAFEEMINDSPLHGAILQMEEVPLEAECELCGRRFLVEGFDFSCPGCSSSQTTIVRGEELVLDSVLLEEEDHGKP